MSRGAPKPTHGVRVKLDFVVFYNEPQDRIPLGKEHVDAMASAIAASLRDSGAASTSPTAANVSLDQRFTVAAVAKMKGSAS